MSGLAGSAHPTPAPIPTLIVGAGGLFGGALAAAARSRPGLLTVIASDIDWRQPESARSQLSAAAAELGRSERWQVIWAAGAGVNGMTPKELETEVRQFKWFLADLAELTGEGMVFVTSSAGGVYAGSAHAPFDENSPTAPLSDYGRTKLAMEDAARDHAAAAGVQVVIGRLANLYGPGQNLSKPQGLISHLCSASIRRAPVSIFVPLDTIRDYLYVDDAARMTLDTMDFARSSGQLLTVKIIATQRGTTIAALLDELKSLTPARPPIILGSSPLAVFQSRDLRFRSVVMTEVDQAATTPLAVGIARTWSNLFESYLQGGTAGRR